MTADPTVCAIGSGSVSKRRAAFELTAWRCPRPSRDADPHRPLVEDGVEATPLNSLQVRDDFPSQKVPTGACDPTGKGRSCCDGLRRIRDDARRRRRCSAVRPPAWSIGHQFHEEWCATREGSKRSVRPPRLFKPPLEPSKMKRGSRLPLSMLSSSRRQSRWTTASWQLSHIG